MVGRPIALALVVVLLTSAVGGVTALEATEATSPPADDLTPAATSPGPAPQQRSGLGAAPGVQVSPDDVFLGVDLRADGGAVWRVEYRVRLETENETAGFESVQGDVENDSSAFADPFAERMRATAADAENATGREMAIENVTVTATTEQLPREYGVVTYQFVWTGFAAVEGDRVVAGDAIAGLFLDDRTTLELSWPEGYEASSVTPAPDDRRSNAAIWTGPTTFGSGEPRLVAAPAATAGPGTTSAGGGDGGASPTTTPGATGSGFPWVPVIGVLALAVAVAVGYRVWTRRDGTPVAPGSADEAEASGAPAPASGTEAGDDPAGAGGSGGDAAAEAADDGGGASGAAAAESGDETGDDEESAPPDELLSNEERVLKLITQRGGRMKQQEVAEALDWTDAKTSQVVRKMRDEGDLDGFRLGRENVLTLPEHDVVGDDEDESEE